MMKQVRAALRRVHRSDQGSITIFVAITYPMLIALVGFGADSSAHTRATERAANIAREAARAGGQALDFTTAVPGGVKQVDPAAAIAAVDAYLITAGLPPCTPASCVISPDLQHITVTVTITQPTFTLQIVGVNSFTVSGTETAALVVG